MPGRTTSDTPLGELIAYHRRRRGLSQVKLAGLLGRSESWLSQVERGVRSIDRISVLMEVARVLDVPPGELAPGTLLPQELESESRVVQALRLTLSAHDELAVLLGQGDDGQRVEFDAGATEAEARRAWDAVHAARYDELAEWLPELLVAVERTAHRAEGQVRQAAFRLLAELQQAVSAMLAKLGAADLAWVAAERSIFAAEQAGEALLAAAGNFRLAHAFLPSGRVDQAAHVVKVTTTALTPHVGPDAPPEVVSIWGAMHLAGSIAATRQNRLDAATRHIREAERAARWLGEDRNDFDTEFGPTNVALHVVAVDVELGNAGDALRRAATVDASGLSAERRARFLIDVARAYGQRRRTQEAVATLLEAEHLTPEQVRSHGLVRETVRDLLRGERYRVDSELRGLARRVGVLP